MLRRWPIHLMNDNYKENNATHTTTLFILILCASVSHFNCARPSNTVVLNRFSVSYCYSLGVNSAVVFIVIVIILGVNWPEHPTQRDKIPATSNVSVHTESENAIWNIASYITANHNSGWAFYTCTQCTAQLKTVRLRTLGWAILTEKSNLNTLTFYCGRGYPVWRCGNQKKDYV